MFENLRAKEIQNLESGIWNLESGIWNLESIPSINYLKFRGSFARVFCLLLSKLIRDETARLRFYAFYGAKP